MGDLIGIGVAVDHRDNGNVELDCLPDRDRFLVGVDHEQDVGQSPHLLDAAECAFQLVSLTREAQQFLLGVADIVIGQLHVHVAQTLDRLGNSLPIGQHAAEPAVVDVVLAAAFGVIGDQVRGLALGADEQHPATAGHHLPDHAHGLVQHGHGLL